jgi:hypothetical protein
MNEAPYTDTSQPIIRADGGIQNGRIIYEPWPSLAIVPQRDLGLCEEIIWAKPGDRLWPFTRRIPFKIVSDVKGIPCHNWRLLELAATSPERMGDMIRRCPALAVLVVQSHGPSDEPRADWMREIAVMRWREILENLGLPPKRRVIRLLKKLPAAHCREQTVNALAEAIRAKHPYVRILSHLSQITRDTVALLRMDRSMVSSLILIASSASDYDEEPTAWLVDNVRFLISGDPVRRGWPYRQLDAETLARVETRLRWQHSAAGCELLAPFPRPPIAGIPGKIEPLRDYRSLGEEADLQKNCVRAFIEDIISGNFYAYAVTVRERATLALRRLGDSETWVVADLRAYDNWEPSEETEHFVTAWLSENSGN